MQNTMSAATQRRMDDAVDQVMRLLVDDLGIELNLELEPGDNFFVIDVLGNAMMMAVMASLVVKGVPPDAMSKTELNQICQGVFTRLGSH
jgi:hypothetical protein